MNATTMDGFFAVDESSASLSDDGDRYYDLDALTNCSLNACTLDGTAEKAATSPQVVAMRVCVDDKQQESLKASFKYRVESFASAIVACEVASNSSMHTISIGKRIEGDEMFHDIIGEGNATRQIVRLKDARKIYSVTIGQLM